MPVVCIIIQGDPGAKGLQGEPGPQGPPASIYSLVVTVTCTLLCFFFPKLPLHFWPQFSGKLSKLSLIMTLILGQHQSAFKELGPREYIIVHCFNSHI